MAQHAVSGTYQTQGAAAGIQVGRTILGGVLGTVAFTVLMYVAPLMGFPKMDVPTMLGTMFVADPGAAFVPGLVMHFMIGIILALGYTIFFASWLPGQAWQRGALYGLVPWLMAMVVVMPMMALMHPLVRSGMMPAPGFFVAGRGTVLAPFGSLMVHLVYGAVVGAISGQPDAAAAQ